MIHIDTAEGGRWLTEEQFKEEFPELYGVMRAPRPFNESGERIRDLRKKHGMTVIEMARAAGIPLAEYSAIESGYEEPTQEQIDAIQWAIQKRGNHGPPQP